MRTLRLLTLFSLLCTSPLTWAGGATFDQTAVRYLGGHDLLRVLASRFPLTFSKQEPICNTLDFSTRSFLGDSDPSLGEPSIRTPSPAFVRWYTKCVSLMIPKEIAAMSESDSGLDRFLGQEVIKKISGTPLERIRKEGSKTFLWNSISSDLKKMIARHVVHHFVGVGIIGDEDAFVTKLLGMIQLKSDSTFAKGLESLVFAMVLQDEFLVY